MLDLDHLKGKTKTYIKERLSFIMISEEGFSKWFDDKFMKYGGIADQDDVDVLRNSIFTALNNLLK